MNLSLPVTSEAQPRPTPEVTVVIATYNMGQYISQAIESVLSQEGPCEFEVIVVNDGSTDDTEAILERFSDNPRVMLINQANSGQPQAKNAGWRAGRGRLVAFCDADDYWMPQKLSLQLPLFRANPRVGVVYSTVCALDTSGDLLSPRKRTHGRGDVLTMLFVENIVPFGTAVVRRECLEQVGGFDESLSMGIDWDLWLRIGLNWEFDFVDTPTYVYRYWEGQMSNNWAGRYESALEIMEKFVHDQPDRIPQAVVRRAYADTYKNYAAAHLTQENPNLKAGLKNTLRSLKACPWYLPTWRMLMFAPIQLVRRRLTGA